VIGLVSHIIFYDVTNNAVTFSQGFIVPKLSRMFTHAPPFINVLQPLSLR